MKKFHFSLAVLLIAILLCGLTAHATTYERLNLTQQQLRAETRRWSSGVFAEPEFYYLRKTYTEAPAKSLPLTFITHSAGAWREENFRTLMEEAEPIFRACGVGVRQIKVVKARLPAPLMQIEHLVHIDTLEASIQQTRLESQVTAGLPTDEGLTVFFFNTLHNLHDKQQRSAWAHGATSTAANQRRPFFRDTNLTPMIHTAWMFSILLAPDFWPLPGMNPYSILAHEIFHVAGDTGHLETPEINLMNTDGLLLGNVLNADQCARLLQYPHLTE